MLVSRGFSTSHVLRIGALRSIFPSTLDILFVKAEILEYGLAPHPRHLLHSGGFLNHDWFKFVNGIVTASHSHCTCMLENPSISWIVGEK